jgi:hypothetical protein
MKWLSQIRCSVMSALLNNSSDFGQLYEGTKLSF